MPAEHVRPDFTSMLLSDVHPFCPIDQHYRRNTAWAPLRPHSPFRAGVAQNNGTTVVVVVPAPRPTDAVAVVEVVVGWAEREQLSTADQVRQLSDGLLRVVSSAANQIAPEYAAS